MEEYSDLDLAICEWMEAKPPADKTYRQLIDEQGDLMVLSDDGGWWIVDTLEGVPDIDAIVEWEPYNAPTKEVTLACEVLDKLRQSFIVEIFANDKGFTVDVVEFHYADHHDLCRYEHHKATATTFPEAICRAAYAAIQGTAE